MIICKGCGAGFKVNERPPVFDGDGQAYHFKCLKSKESSNVPEAEASAERISSVV